MVQRVARIRHVVLRDALWLNADRAVAFSRVLLLVWLGLTVSVIVGLLERVLLRWR